jgi:hypothetical protein
MNMSRVNSAADGRVPAAFACNEVLNQTWQSRQRTAGEAGTHYRRSRYPLPAKPVTDPG